MAVGRRTRAELEDLYGGIDWNDAEERSRALFALSEPMVEVQRALNEYKERYLRAVESRDLAAGLAAVRALQSDLGRMSAEEGRDYRVPAGRYGSMLGRALSIAARGGHEVHSPESAGHFPAVRRSKEVHEWLEGRLAPLGLLSADDGPETLRDLADRAWEEFDFGGRLVEEVNGWESGERDGGAELFTRVFFVEPGEEAGWGAPSEKCSFRVRVPLDGVSPVEAVAYDSSGAEFGSAAPSVMARRP